MNRASPLSLLVLSVLILGSVSPAFAAQLNWDAKTYENAQTPKFIFQRTAFLEYKDGGSIADALRGQDASITFSADSTSEGAQDLIDKINEHLVAVKSTVRVTDVRLEYSATMVGRADYVSVDYKIVLIPTMEGFLIREYQEGSPALFDATWRGIKVDGPIVITSEEHGPVDINQPISFFTALYPDVASQITGEARSVLEMGLIDASGIGNQPLPNWHFLFDPTGIAADTTRFGFSGAKVVVSSFTMGESSLREGQVKEKEFEATFTSDQTYNVRTVQSGDAANVFLAGYASPDTLDGHEVIGVSAVVPQGAAQTSTGSFPVFIIYGMAGMAAAGAGGFFVWSSRKAKRETEYIQTGIDPKHLRATSTSEAAGGYHTVRGEAELATDDQTYKQHQSVYDSQTALPKDEEKPKSTRGAMPKDWKPS